MPNLIYAMTIYTYIHTKVHVVLRPLQTIGLACLRQRPSYDIKENPQYELFGVTPELSPRLRCGYQLVTTAGHNHTVRF